MEKIVTQEGLYDFVVTCAVKDARDSINRSDIVNDLYVQLVTELVRENVDKINSEMTKIQGKTYTVDEIISLYKSREGLR